MTLIEIIKNKTNQLGTLSFCIIYFSALLFSIGMLAYMRPIHAPDTDLWYHLHAGRHFIQTGQLLNDATYSFLEPLREGVNYYWGFQWIIFTLFQNFDYKGLILFRTATVGLLCLLVLHTA